MTDAQEVASPVVVALMTRLSSRGLRLAIAESLTGGLVTAEFIRPPGASAVVSGGVIAYDTGIKRTVLGVDGDLLDEHGPVHPEVARQMADRVRRVLSVDGEPADIGLATTGVAGPDPQGGIEQGTVFVGIAIGDRVEAVELHLEGTRDMVRARTVTAVVAALDERV
ncbi:nicotinamide-nucleotide amidase [Diaminobutyricimonas aerilata]|uniref:Nicotinamide-nucleotide amidase n=1 Tax=Diaminobutyricimonas aerilata TaxID=1162967 RepID=A0A2M9CKV2_9MICO|nr:nicotinamide-nucleotide amidohydrolase family protein [Diaminobutyricimonas aerilata]PJJ72514.1 nicotinamide-nucleotide amidase [Diaminobutyricimonas aerilata]